MAEAIIGAQMRARNPEPCVRLVGPSDLAVVFLMPLPMQPPQVMRTISHAVTHLRASMPSPMSRGMSGGDRAIPDGSVAELPLLPSRPPSRRPLRRHRSLVGSDTHAI